MLDRKNLARTIMAALIVNLAGQAFAAADTGAVPPPGVRDALQGQRLGLYPGSDFRLADGQCKDCAALPQALFYFRDEVIAVPKAGLPVSGFSTTERGRDDVQAWAASGAQALAYPGLVWLGAPQTVEAAIAPDGASLKLPGGALLPWQPVPKIATNLSYFDASTLAFFGAGPVRMRGSAQQHDGQPRFVARTIWPSDYVIKAQSLRLAPLAGKNALVDYVRAHDGGAKSAYDNRLIWERHPGAGRQWQGRPVLGIMLNGAQGDDDEAYGGHFAIATGTMGPGGEMADWIVNNFYALDAYGEKGILAAPVPMDNYLADLNSGQSYYRPSYMLVAVLNQARTAAAYQGGVQRIYNQYYRHDIAYDGALNNCAGLSMDVFAALGWHIPQRGPTHALMALAGYPYKAISTGKLTEGRKAYEYLNEEQTRLYPAVAFDAAGQDLLQLVSGKPGRVLTPFEQQLQSDVEALILVRIPQFPSSRAFGSAPVFSYDEFMARAPADHADWKIVPVEPRPFPASLRDGLASALPQRSVLPLPVGLAGGGLLALLVGGALLARRLWRKKRKDRRSD
ncbi:hypothetical protein [Janthinobacterium aquaticum]|uniref:hypothetical protein n=1 Tax=Janthinobacterium sp. FT58W TaxID=2654254 RepID=UPI0012644BE2|nr:hypothetical protein [Janthinobacterium sp. FT58W]KAB8042778.1 hypothetical protein GCM43_12000 [Janthinobacterium sp. FT58W]